MSPDPLNATLPLSTYVKRGGQRWRKEGGIYMSPDPLNPSFIVKIQIIKLNHTNFKFLLVVVG